MVPVLINIDELTSEFNLTGKDVSALKEEILSGLVMELYRWWGKEARDTLKSTRGEYIRSLKVFKDGQFRGGVELLGKLPNMLESGATAFDMKLGMLRSDKAKIGKKGQVYITVPFRIGTPDAVGDNFSGTMSRPVYAVAKNLTGTQQVKKGDLSGPDAIPQTRAFIQTQKKVFEEYVHKSPTSVGIQKAQGTNHGQYFSFRRISSTASDPNSWIHKGLTAHKLAEKALDDMNIVLVTDNSINDFLNQKFG